MEQHTGYDVPVDPLSKGYQSHCMAEGSKAATQIELICFFLDFLKQLQMKIQFDKLQGVTYLGEEYWMYERLFTYQINFLSCLGILDT